MCSLVNTHELKTDPASFDDVQSGKKTHEIRFDDRQFKVGDLLCLKKTAHSCADMLAGLPLVYTGDEIIKSVSHIQSGYGLKDGWVILSLADKDYTLVPNTPNDAMVYAAVEHKFITSYNDCDEPVYNCLGSNDFKALWGKLIRCAGVAGRRK